MDRVQKAFLICVMAARQIHRSIIGKGYGDYVEFNAFLRL